MNANIDVKIEDNSQRVLDEFERKVQLALNAIGATAQGYAVSDCPVDTGRLRNSIVWATRTKTGSGNKSGGQSASAEDSRVKAQPEDTSVYIGTNVVYAPAVEFRSIDHRVGKAHFLRDAATTHGDEYKQLVEAVLKD
jgi:hypothetical protein